MTMALPPLPVSISFSVVIFILTYKLYQRLRFKLPPGPGPWPVVGNLYHIKPVRFRCYAEWAQSYGPIISVWIGSTLNVVVSNTELARQVLKDHDQKLADRHRNRSAAKFSKDGQDLIWADYGPHYVKVRKVCTLELFSPKRIEALRPIREDEVTAMVESIYNHCTAAGNYGKNLSVREYLGAVAFNNITRLAFGKRFVNSEDVLDKQGLEFKAITANGLKLGASLAMAEHIPWLRWMFPLEEEAFAKHGERRDRLTREIMEEHTQKRNKSGGVAKQHFVDALLTLQEKYDLSEDTIIGLLWDMITAGMDTTAISVEWAMAELIKNPRVQQKAQEELDRVIGLERVMTETDFSGLPYLQCVAKEALRMHPPTPLMLPHRANANVKIGGYDIPKGSNVHVNVWAVARDPAVWKDPHEFRPERFLEEDVDMKAATNNFLAKRLTSSSSSPSWRCTIRGKDTVVFQRKFRRKLPTQELRNRLSMLCRSHHTSIIKLLGASVSGDNLFLVYEFVPNSASLAACLRNKNNPDFTVLSTWVSRMQVAADLAQGLDYVHNNTGLNITIVHNRIKSSSVLVTEPNCNARICHFGTAQLCGEADFHTQMDSKPKSAGSGEIIEVSEEMERRSKSKPGPQFEGQRGYMSPEFQTSGVATQKCDVYAFGVVILELLSGQEPLKFKFNKTRGDFISTTVVDSARAAVASGDLRTWVDRRLKDSFPVEVAEKMTRVALECVHVDPDKRPSMGRVAGKISKFYLESRTWSEKFSIPTGISISLGPR